MQDTAPNVDTNQELHHDNNGDSSTDKQQQQQQQYTHDPLLLLTKRSNLVQENEHVILSFADGRQVFALCCKSYKGKHVPLKLHKRSYPTHNLIGLPYGSVLEQGSSQMIPLPASEPLLPPVLSMDGQELQSNGDHDNSNHNNNNNDSTARVRDNRNLIDNNTSQKLKEEDLWQMKRQGHDGATIVEKLLQHSTTFAQKTDYSKAKYIAKKQMKHQPRCRIVKCTAATIAEAYALKEARKIMNIRPDTIGQILAHANVFAGCQVMVLETCMGIITGAVAERLGGYGKVLSIYSGQQPAYKESMEKFNLSFAENSTIKWLHTGDVFRQVANEHDDDEEEDLEKKDRLVLQWPCPLQPHTKQYLKEMKDEKEQRDFLLKRSHRFARKLTRHSPLEAKAWLQERQCDSLILVSTYDPTETLLKMLPFLAPSCPFVIYCEYSEPLTECFRTLQQQNLAINLRLSDTWARGYQVLPGRTHPNMTMTQSGGFLLVGTKLDPVHGNNEIDAALAKEMRTQIGHKRKRDRKFAKEIKRQKIERERANNKS